MQNRALVAVKQSYYSTTLNVESHSNRLFKGSKRTSKSLNLFFGLLAIP